MIVDARCYIHLRWSCYMEGVSINFLMVLLRASGSQPERIERNRQTDTLLEKMRRNLIDSRHFIIAPEFDHCTKIGKYQVCTLWLAFSSIFMPQIIYILSIQALGGWGGALTAPPPIRDYVIYEGPHISSSWFSSSQEACLGTLLSALAGKIWRLGMRWNCFLS